MNKIELLFLSIALFFPELIHANTPPYILTNFNTISFNEDDTLRLNLAPYFADSDGIIVRYTIKSLNNGSALIPDSIATIIPDKDYFGSLNGIAMAVDDSGDSCSNYFSFIVNDVNDPPRFLTSINDTSITNNLSDTINLEPYVNDVDNQNSELSLSVVPITGVKFGISHLILSISPITYIDTADIHVLVTDPLGLTDMTTFKIFTNKQTPCGIPFSLGPGGSVISKDLSPVKAIRNVDSSFYLDSYNDRGQKVILPSKLNISKLKKGAFVEFNQFDNGNYFFRSDISDSGWDYLFLDSNCFPIGSYPFHRQMYPKIARNSDKIFIAGRTIYGERLLFIDIFNNNFSLLRTDTVKTDTIQPSINAILLNRNIYTVFWTEYAFPRAADSLYVYGQLFAQSFNIDDGTISAPKKALLPYIKTDTVRTINDILTASVCQKDSTGYVILWSFDNAKRISENGLSLVANTVAYLLKVNTSFIQTENYRILFQDTINGSGMNEMRVMKIIPIKNQYFIVFSTGFVGYDGVKYYYNYYNSSFYPSSFTRPDTPVCFAETNTYTLINDSTVFRRESCYFGGPFGTFIRINSNTQTAIDTKPPHVPNANGCTPCIHINAFKNLAVIKSPGVFHVELYSLTGKRLSSETSKDFLQLLISAIYSYHLLYSMNENKRLPIPASCRTRRCTAQSCTGSFEWKNAKRSCQNILCHSESCRKMGCGLSDRRGESPACQPSRSSSGWEPGALAILSNCTFYYRPLSGSGKTAFYALDTGGSRTAHQESIWYIPFYMDGRTLSCEVGIYSSKTSSKSIRTESSRSRTLDERAVPSNKISCQNRAGDDILGRRNRDAFGPCFWKNLFQTWTDAGCTGDGDAIWMQYDLGDHQQRPFGVYGVQEQV